MSTSAARFNMQQRLRDAAKAERNAALIEEIHAQQVAFDAMQAALLAPHVRLDNIVDEARRIFARRASDRRIADRRQS